MLELVYQSEVVPYEPWDGVEQVYPPPSYNLYLITPPRIYRETVWILLFPFTTRQFSVGAENTVKLCAIVDTINYTEGNFIRFWSFDGVSGAFKSRLEFGGGFSAINIHAMSMSLAGQPYARTGSTLRAMDQDTLQPTGVEYPPSHWSATYGFSPTFFGIDEFNDLIVMQGSDNQDNDVSVHRISTGTLVRKIKVGGNLGAIAMESVGRAYAVHTNGVVSVIDYLAGAVVGILRIPGLANSAYVNIVTWDPVYKRILLVIRTPDATDGASTIRVLGYSNLPVVTNLTPPLPLRALRAGRDVPVIVRAYGDAGEPIPSVEIGMTEVGAGIVQPASRTTDGVGYAQFNLNCAGEGASALDAQTTVIDPPPPP